MKINFTKNTLRNLWLFVAVFAFYDATAQTATVSNFTNFTYTKRALAVTISPNVSVTNGINYSDSHF